MGRVESGRGWGERAAGWAYLAEPYARRVNEALSGRLGVVPGTRLADIACGSGYAANLAAGRGAVVAGLDASEALIAIARARTPAGDFRVGDMFALPFADDSFDAAARFNGIWKGWPGAPGGAPGGTAGRPDRVHLLGFTQPGLQTGLLPYFAALAELSPASHVEATITQGDTGRPGAARADAR